jgi:2,3-bisphosphoglycerate-independent phosphoglycerate mutase
MSVKTKMLCILDGFGLSKPAPNNAISLANTPTIDHLFNHYPWISLDADGQKVGQEMAVVGNSEVGHINIGGLGLVPQLSYEITQSSTRDYRLGSDAQNQLFDPRKLLQSHHQNNLGKIHLVTLFSSGQVHSDLRHLRAAINVAVEIGYPQIHLHLFSDGRDSSRDSFVTVLEDFISSFDQTIQAKLVIASISGRYWGMDRDKNWDRVYKNLQVQIHASIQSQIAGQDITSTPIISNLASGDTSSIATENKSIKSQISGICEYVKASYKDQVFDENIQPAKCLIDGQDQGIESGDCIYFLNYRTDRIKQICQMYLSLNLHFGFKWLILASNDYGVEGFESFGVDQFSRDAPSTASYYPVFKFQPVKYTLSKAIAEQAKTQLHIAETEKFNHITYFINGGSETKQKGEQWKVFDSHKVSSHSQKPQMRAAEIADYIIQEGIGKYDYIIVNFANADMVGHTGDINAAKIAVETLDQQLHKFLEYVDNGNLEILITADHGNIEIVGPSPSGQIDTKHNPNPVPCLLISKQLDLQVISQNLAKQNQTMPHRVDINKVIEGLKDSIDDTDLASTDWMLKEMDKADLAPLWYIGRIFLAL